MELSSSARGGPNGAKARARKFPNFRPGPRKRSARADFPAFKRLNQELTKFLHDPPERCKHRGVALEQPRPPPGQASLSVGDHRSRAIRTRSPLPPDIPTQGTLYITRSGPKTRNSWTSVKYLETGSPSLMGVVEILNHTLDNPGLFSLDVVRTIVGDGSLHLAEASDNSFVGVSG